MKEYKYSINGNEYTVAVIDLDVNTAAVEVNGTSYKVDILGEELNITPRPAVKPAAPVAPAPQPQAATPAPVAQTAPAEQPAAPAPATGGTPVTAPMAGNIWKVVATEGQTVAAGDVLFILEAMKMETEVKAAQAGTVRGICVKAGDAVAVGDTVMTLA